ncbi:Hypothetical protein (Fragment) [Durusdinium trenchii]|uniref:Uncharacterized protein n=1 Tax=Durusdinium trenchii TaxID=1381693 RepID=A0ABP0LV09_9DINO
MASQRGQGRYLSLRDGAEPHVGREPLWELGLADNFITDKGLEELLRPRRACLDREGGWGGTAWICPDVLGGAEGAFPETQQSPKALAYLGILALMPSNGPSNAVQCHDETALTVDPPRMVQGLDMKNNLVRDHPSLIQRVESAGGTGAVQLYVTEGDGPPPQPAESGLTLRERQCVYRANEDKKEEDRGKEKSKDKDSSPMCDKKDKKEEKRKAGRERSDSAALVAALVAFVGSRSRSRRRRKGRRRSRSSSSRSKAREKVQRSKVGGTMVTGMRRSSRPPERWRLGSLGKFPMDMISFRGLTALYVQRGMAVALPHLLQRDQAHTSPSVRSMGNQLVGSLENGVDSLLAEIRQSTAPYASNGAHCCLEMLDVSGIALQDSGAQKLFQEMTELGVAVRRLMVAGNSLGDQAMTALSAYLWQSPEPLWDLGLADNLITDKGLEELLRCLYNHPSHPPCVPDAQGGHTGAFALRLDMKNNLVRDHTSLIKRVESAGGAGAVQLVTEREGSFWQSADSGRPLPYLWVFLPRLSEQKRKGKEKDKKDKKRKGSKKRKKSSPSRSRSGSRSSGSSGSRKRRRRRKRRKASRSRSRSRSRSSHSSASTRSRSRKRRRRRRRKVSRSASRSRSSGRSRSRSRKGRRRSSSSSRSKSKSSGEG